jgi:hypothetical protein
MKNRLTLIVCIFLITHSVFGISEFQWFNIVNKKYERIDLKTGAFEQRFLNGIWEKKADIQFNGIDLKAIPAQCFPQKLGYKGKDLITIPGTGQVYLFDRNAKQLTRLDETFYHGYNFLATHYIHSDTLFSLGGYGFWQFNNLLTFFDFKNKEWEVKKTTGDAPSGGVLNWSTSLPNYNNKLVAIEAVGNQDSPRSILSFAELDLVKNQWKKIGRIDLAKWKILGLNSANFQSIHELLFFNDPQIGFFADPTSNQLYKYEGGNKLFFMNDSKLYAKGKWVYSVRVNLNKGFEQQVKIDSITIDQIKADSRLIGEMYQQDAWFTLERISLLLFSLILMVSLGYNFKKSRPRQLPDIHSSPIYFLPKGGGDFLEIFKINGPDYLISTQEISIMLDCDKKAFDTQRQYRSHFINSMNKFFEDNFAIEGAIFRKSMDDDKRFIKYGIKPEALESIKNL